MISANKLRVGAYAFKTLVKDPDWPSGRAAVDYYFIQDDGGMFKCTFQYEPYFLIACKVSIQQPHLNLLKECSLGQRMWLKNGLRRPMKAWFFELFANTRKT